LKQNPLNFKHFKLDTLIVKVNGQPRPWSSIKTNFEEKRHLLAYLSTFQGTGTLFQDKGLGIDPFDDYPNGLSLFAFNLTPNSSVISAEIKLKEACADPITIITYLEYEEIIELDKDGNLIDENII